MHNLCQCALTGCSSSSLGPRHHVLSRFSPCPLALCRPPHLSFSLDRLLRVPPPGHVRPRQSCLLQGILLARTELRRCTAASLRRPLGPPPPHALERHCFKAFAYMKRTRHSLMNNGSGCLGCNLLVPACGAVQLQLGRKVRFGPNASALIAIAKREIFDRELTQSHVHTRTIARMFCSWHGAQDQEGKE